VPLYYTGADCSVVNTGHRPFQNLSFVGEDVDGVTTLPLTVTLPSREYVYFAFNVPSAELPMELVLSLNPHATPRRIEDCFLVAAYAAQIPQPTIVSVRRAALPRCHRGCVRMCGCVVVCVCVCVWLWLWLCVLVLMVCGCVRCRCSEPVLARPR
jgi:hypothetical protein